MSKKIHGNKDAVRGVRRPLPKDGKVKTYILSSAQNNTHVHKKCWENLRAYAEHLDAEIMVATFTYNKASIGAKNAKRKTSKEGDDSAREWWASEVEPFICDQRTVLAPGLVWCGELQMLPTAVNPITGLESYTGRKSSILPHPKFAVQSIPSPKHSGTKFIYTTGAVTLRNYIQKKAGQKAEFHHGYGAVIVQVGRTGAWFVLQLCAGNDGTFYDFDTRVKNGKITGGHRPEALVWGDIHERQLKADMLALCFGKGGILNTLRPKVQVMHDLIDFRSQNHHDRDDSWKVFKKFCDHGLKVEKELFDAATFLNKAARKWCPTMVACSNHDMALVRWLKEADFRADPENALFFLEANHAAYKAMARRQPFNPLAWAFRGGIIPSNIKFLERDESFVVCPDKSGGIELGMHGDVGANGARTALRGFAKTGRKCIIGHSHSAGWFEGATQVGVTGDLDQGYNQGMSSWSHTNALVYPNGKRTLFTIWGGKWRA